jgi:hypothetical protein
MRNLLALTGAAVLAFAGVGYYLDWYKIKPNTPSITGHQNVNVDINGGKIADDLHKGIQKGEEKLHTVLDKRPHEADISKHAEKLSDGPDLETPKE